MILEKESRALASLNVTPLKVSEYFLICRETNQLSSINSYDSELFQNRRS